MLKTATCNLNPSRTFMINPAEESMPRQPDSSVVHWLNAINPDLFTEQAIRYVKHTHQTIYHPSYSRHPFNMHVLTQTRVHAHSGIRIHQHTPPPTVCREPCVCVCVCGCITRLTRCAELQARVVANITQM